MIYMKTAGIIGGLGPETTSKFYLETIFSSFDKDKINRPPILIWNVPLPYQVEEEFILKGIGERKYLPFLIDAAQRLEKGGADFIVIPCNSVHILIDEVRKSVHIPILSIVEETVNFLTREKISDVGLLATSTTVRQKLYEGSLVKNRVKIHIPDDSDQNQIGNIINTLVHSRQDAEDKQKLLAITQKFIDRGITTVLLACTDLQLITPVLKNAEIIDTMDILVQATVREIFK